MPLLRTIHRAALVAEKPIDALIRRRQRGRRPILEPYLGYATPDTLIARGRVLTALRRSEPLPTQSKWANFKQMLSLFLTDEVADVTVVAGEHEAVSDEEGYVTLVLERGGTAPGWHEIPVTVKGEDHPELFPVLVPRADARFGVISDIDDTMLETGAYSLARNLWTSLTGSVDTRSLFPDSVKLMERLSEDGLNPVFYVSSSPWNLHWFLQEIFAAHGLVRGPTFLRDLGLSETQFISGTHGDHKGASIDAILLANPGLPFVLIGDTGQHDAHVYLDAARRHPGRIARVILREPGPGPDAASSHAIEEIEADGVEVFHAPSFEGLLERPVVVDVSAGRRVTLRGEEA